MAYQPETVMGFPPPPRRGWWSRPIATFPAKHDRKPTCKEGTAFLTPCLGGILTVFAVLLYMYNIVDHAHCHAKFSIQSIAVSPSSATWHVDFLVKNPSSRYTMYYGGDDDETAVRLGPLNAAVISTSHERVSPTHTAFSLDFVAEDNPNGALPEPLSIKLKAIHKVYGDTFDTAGHVEIRCHNLAQGHENVEKIHCHSSFTKLKTLYSRD